tara:strand:- start:4539 stop:5708 length:1170 start_codon:yes stop_codon:yes gene_type:complete
MGEQLDLFEIKEDEFNFELMKQKLIDNLDMLKNMTVEEQTLYKKWQEMNKGGKMSKVKKKLLTYKNNLWAPTDIFNVEQTIKEIEELEPYVEMASPGKGVTEWVNYRKLIHTMEWVANPGRNMKFWVRDKKTNKVLGLICLGSDVTSIKVRDAYIGWDKVNKFEQHKLNNTAIATTICSTQPGGYNMLMGKLVAALTTCKTIRDAWEEKYGDKLIAVGTTSLYGINSMYNGMPHFKTMGETAGQVRLKPDDKVYLPWNTWLKENHPEEHKKAINATGPKQNIINKVFKHCSIRPSTYDHGFKRGVYLAMMYENGCEFLRNEIDKNELKLKKKFEDDIPYTEKWWKKKAVKRYTNMKKQGRIKPDSLFYWDVIDMDWESTKNNYLKDVGR